MVQMRHRAIPDQHILKVWCLVQQTQFPPPFLMADLGGGDLGMECFSSGGAGAQGQSSRPAHSVFVLVLTHLVLALVPAHPVLVLGLAHLVLILGPAPPGACSRAGPTRCLFSGRAGKGHRGWGSGKPPTGGRGDKLEKERAKGQGSFIPPFLL